MHELQQGLLLSSFNFLYYLLRRIKLSQDLPASLAKLFPIKAVFFSQKIREFLQCLFCQLLLMARQLIPS